MSLHPVRLLMLLAAVAAPRTIAVETGRIEGHVRNATSGTPIANAQVVVVGTSLTAVTSDSGFYAIANVPVGTYTVRAQFIGYKPADSSGVRVAANQTVTVDLRLQLSPVMLTGIVVTGAPSPAAERLSVSSSSVTINGVMARQRGAARADVGRGYPPQTPEPWRYQGQPGNREQYDEIVENPFVAVSVDPLSTFSIDVDRASYSNVRRFIMQEGQLPPPDAVRIEELVNYFPYSYAEPEGDAPLAIHAEVGAAPWKPQHRLVRIGLQARRVHLENLPPSNFVFLLDVSGSMMDENKLPLVKAAMRRLRGSRPAIHSGHREGQDPRCHRASRGRGQHGRRRRYSAGLRRSGRELHSRRQQPRHPRDGRRFQRRRVERCGNGPVDRREASDGCVPHRAGRRRGQPPGGEDGEARRPRERQLRLSRQSLRGAEGAGA